MDADGNVFVTDTGNEKIRKISSSGYVTTIAGSTTGYYDALGTAAQFDYPYGIAVDTSGNIYVADHFNFAIRQISPDGNVTTVAGGSPGSSRRSRI